MVKASIIVVTAVLFAVPQVAPADYSAGRSFNYFDKTAYKDKDWNVMFHENCQLPAYSSTQWVEEQGERFLRFTLKNGQVGGCSSDNRARHGAPGQRRQALGDGHRQAGLVDRK